MLDIPPPVWLHRRKPGVSEEEEGMICAGSLRHIPLVDLDNILYFRCISDLSLWRRRRR
jgi:hypothetical protein